MIELKRETYKNITIIILVDKISTKYVSFSGDIKEIDTHYCYRIAEMARNGKYGKRKKYTITERFTAISNSKAYKNIAQSNNDINRLINITGVPFSGGVTTMLKNKGII